jgi:hypothetical protein
LCIFVLSGCQTVRYVPIEIIKKEYSDKYFRDSVYLYDSVIVKEKGDTFLLEKYKYLYKNKYVKDSVFIRDSIQVPYPVVEFKEVNKVTGWQNFQIWSGRILLSMISLVVLFFFVKRRFF